MLLEMLAMMLSFYDVLPVTLVTGNLLRAAELTGAGLVALRNVASPSIL